MSKSILELTSAEAFNYFMQSEHYHNFELPEYYKFDGILEFVRKTIGDNPYLDCVSKVSPESLSDVNMDLLLNKDGRYAVRPLTLANPYLYYFLVRELCTDDGWKMTQDCFEKYTMPHITSCALPQVKDPGKKESFHHATTILNWWNSMEQRSIELSLEYRYMFVTDITNCYGSINPQSIDWALTFKGTKFEKQEYLPAAGNIRQYLRALQQGRNIGIPQGSSIFDFVGEFVLGYADLLLSEALEKEGIKDGYEIIRYRDDYRVFCNDRDMLEKISYTLQHVLEGLNLRLNSNKTFISNSIITDSIKLDKLNYIENTPIFNKKGCDFDGLQKHLLYILLFGRKYPNGGQLRTMLSDLDKRIERRLRPKKKKTKKQSEKFEDVDLGLTDSDIDAVEAAINAETGSGIFDKLKEYPTKRKIWENIMAMSAICAQIAIENVSCVHYALRVMSRMVDSIEDNDEKWAIFDKVCSKLVSRPNSDYDKIWLQNITYQRDNNAGECPYDVRLCQLTCGEEVQLWDNSWLKPSFTKYLPMVSICDKDLLATLTPVIIFRETRAYYE